MAQNEALGVGISFYRRPLYSFYTTVPRLWGISVLDDQICWAAPFMWVPGGMMYALAAIVLLASLLDYGEEKTALSQKGRT